MPVQLINTRNNRVEAEGDDVLGHLKKVKQIMRREDVLFYRERIAYDEYTITFWTAHPIKGAGAESPLKLTGIKRKHLQRFGKLIDGMPRAHVIPKPSKPARPMKPK